MSKLGARARTWESTRPASRVGGLGCSTARRPWSCRIGHGQIATTHSVSAGLDYPAIGPEHVLLHDEGRVEYTSASDAEAIDAFHLLAATEGILPALESAHAIAEAVKHARHLSSKKIVVINLSGRGDKDVESVLEYDAKRSESERQKAGASRHPAETWKHVVWGGDR